MILKCLVALAIIVLPFLPIVLFNHDKCYKNMESDGHAKDGCCCGQVGGNASTENLSMCCCDCKYFNANQLG